MVWCLNAIQQYQLSAPRICLFPHMSVAISLQSLFDSHSLVLWWQRFRSLAKCQVCMYSWALMASVVSGQVVLNSLHICLQNFRLKSVQRSFCNRCKLSDTNQIICNEVMLQCAPGSVFLGEEFLPYTHIHTPVYKCTIDSSLAIVTLTVYVSKFWHIFADTQYFLSSVVIDQSWQLNCYSPTVMDQVQVLSTPFLWFHHNDSFPS